MVKIVFSILILLLIPLDTFAHSGGTDAEGCHKNRKTGDYHCHNKKVKLQKDKTPTPSANEKISNPQKNKRIHQWVDEKGEIHYSSNVNDVPLSARESAEELINSK